MKKLILIIIIICSFIFNACTENQRVRNFGGKTSIDIPKGQKVVEITWKGEDLWYATRPMREDEKPETYYFREESSFGLFEGTVIIRERE